jgi:Ca-activated chloride channel family protein
MLQTYFSHPRALALLAALPLALALGWIAARRRRRALALWGASVFAFRTGWLGRLKATAAFFGFLALVVALAGPLWGTDESVEAATGRDLVCVLDVSRSMLAEDVLPNRLERAKSTLQRLSRSIQDRGGYRVALVIFAASAKVACPLTHDYEHFRAAAASVEAAELDPDIGLADSGSLSGTRIGAALRAAVDAQDLASRGFQDILLVSDGDDPVPDDEWRKGIQVAHVAGIPVFTLGIGDPVNAQPVPGPSGASLHHDKKAVMTRLDEEKLEDIAQETGGNYLAMRTADLSPADWFQDQIVSKSTTPLAEDSVRTRRQWYAWPMALGLFFFALNIALPGPGNKLLAAMFERKKRTAMVAIGSLALISASGPADDWLRRGTAAYANGDFQLALELYARAEDRTHDPGLVAFNEAAAFYQLGQDREAELRCRRSLEDAEGPRLTRTMYNLANSLVRQGHTDNGRVLSDAITGYERCLRQPGIDPGLAASARYNLELAKLLMQNARANRSKQDANSDAKLQEDRSPNSGDRTSLDGTDEDNQAGADPALGNPGGDSDAASRARGQRRASQPGRGNIPPLPDSPTSPNLSPDDARVHLQEAAERIQGERRRQRLRPPLPTRADVKDW